MDATQTQLRMAATTDARSLAALEHQCFDYSQMGLRSFQRLLRSPTAFIKVIVRQSDQQLLGYSLLLRRKNSRTWRLYSIASAPAARGLGVGKRLLEEAIKDAQQHGAERVSLEVMTSNKAAIQLYRQFDFEVTDVLSDYYAEGIDGYRMRLTLPDAAK